MDVSGRSEATSGRHRVTNLLGHRWTIDRTIHAARRPITCSRRCRPAEVPAESDDGPPPTIGMHPVGEATGAMRRRHSKPADESLGDRSLRGPRGGHSAAECLAVRDASACLVHADRPATGEERAGDPRAGPPGRAVRAPRCSPGGSYARPWPVPGGAVSGSFRRCSIKGPPGARAALSYAPGQLIFPGPLSWFSGSALDPPLEHARGRQILGEEHQLTVRRGRRLAVPAHVHASA
jgi:hypothetical protein